MNFYLFVFKLRIDVESKCNANTGVKSGKNNVFVQVACTENVTH